MSKGMIFVDIPKECDVCDFKKLIGGEDYCSLTGETCPLLDKPDWCPIKLLPQQRKVDQFPENKGMFSEMAILNIGRQIGWNECLNEMEDH